MGVVCIEGVWKGVWFALKGVVCIEGCVVCIEWVWFALKGCGLH